MEKKGDSKEELYDVRDLYLAATLVSLKFYISRVDFQIEGDKPQPVGYFMFENTPKLQEAVQRYWQGLLVVEPREFVTNMRSLKAQVVNAYKSPHRNFN